MLGTFESSAKVVADSVNLYGARIITFEVEAPRYLLAEVNTHRVIARSAASSRAIPVAKRIKMVQDFPYVPDSFGKNRPGMQAESEVEDQEAARSIWLDAVNAMLDAAQRMDALGVHKQQANRLLEPFCAYTGVMTGTEWENFFKLRNHKDADPGFNDLAAKMYDAMRMSDPVERSHHLPYTDTGVHPGTSTEDLFHISAARCARVSYKTFDGKVSLPESDIQLCKDLIGAGHLSPFDHVASADTVVTRTGNIYWKNPVDHRHLWGWIPRRVEIEKQLSWTCARSSFDPL